MQYKFLNFYQLKIVHSSGLLIVLVKVSNTFFYLSIKPFLFCSGVYSQPHLDFPPSSATAPKCVGIQQVMKMDGCDSEGTRGNDTTVSAMVLIRKYSIYSTFLYLFTKNYQTCVLSCLLIFLVNLHTGRRYKNEEDTKRHIDE